MIELVFIVCLRASPEACEERAISYEATPSPVYCMIEAQPHLAEWARTHPDYVIQHWKCSTGRRPERA